MDTYYTTLEYALANNDIAVIFCDWDDTLFSWQDIKMDSAEMDSESTQDYLSHANWYIYHSDIIVPIDFMQKFLKAVKSKVDALYGLSWMSDTLPLRSKREMLDKYYNRLFDDMFGTGTREEKIATMQRICKARNWDARQALLIDDHPSTRSEARKAGFVTISPIGVYTSFQSLNGELPTRRPTPSIGYIPIAPEKID